MLPIRVCQAFGQVGNRIVEGQVAHGQLGFLGLLLLVFGSTFLGAPLVLLLLIHEVLRLHLTHPGTHHGVDASLAAGKVTGYVADKVQPLLLAVHV